MKSLDPDRKAEILAALELEEARRMAERVAQGRVARLICDLRIGETEEAVIAAYRAAHPGEDKFFILRVVYDAPPPRPASTDGWRQYVNNSPVVWPDEDEQTLVERALNRPIRYPPMGLA